MSSSTVDTVAILWYSTHLVPAILRENYMHEMNLLSHLDVKKYINALSLREFSQTALIGSLQDFDGLFDFRRSAVTSAAWSVLECQSWHVGTRNSRHSKLNQPATLTPIAD